MPVLAYCIVAAEAALRAPAEGVAGAPLESATAAGLRVFFSSFRTRADVAGSSAVEAALAFHRTLQEFFKQADLIPFRFPTFLGSPEEIGGYLAEHAQEHLESLARLRGMVQIEIRIGREQKPCFEPSLSGAEYLRGRQAYRAQMEAAAQAFHEAASRFISDWRQRESRDVIRCYALVARTMVPQLAEELRPLAHQPDLDVRISGPWPATEFLREQTHLS